MNWVLIFGWSKEDKHTPHQTLCSCSPPLHKHLAGFQRKIYALKLALTIAINCNNQA